MVYPARGGGERKLPVRQLPERVCLKNQPDYTTLYR